jgi:hypothetical protein
VRPTSSASKLDRIPLAALISSARHPEPEQAVVLLVALAIFVFLAWATWAVSVACYRSTFTEWADLTAEPNYSTVAGCAIAAVVVTCFVPFPFGYIAALVVWGVAVYGYLSLSRTRATVLFGYLAAWSVVTRLVVLGVLTASAK